MRGCPICASDKYTLFLAKKIEPTKVSDATYASRKEPEFMRHQLVRCVNCSLIYANDPPTDDFLKTAYTQASYDSGDEAICAAITYYRHLKSFMATLPVKNLAVDVGAGNGAFLPMLELAGFEEVMGIEPSVEAAKSCSRNLSQKIKQEVFTANCLKDTKPDFICSFMTLEHLANPKQFIADVASHLNISGGGVAIVVHNCDAFLNKILGAKSPIIDVEHLQLFNPQSIRFLLENNGFSAIKINKLKNQYPLKYWLRISPLPKFIKNTVQKIFNWLGLAETLLSVNVGNILVTAKKT